ncbi:unnamed protein product, partial [Rotaria magnacalcarata]
MDSDSDETLSDENDSSISSDELERSDSEDDDSLVEEFRQNSMDDWEWKVNNSSFSASLNYYDGHALGNNVIQPIHSFFTFISQGEDAKNRKEINENQIHAFLGLLFIMGFHKLPRIRDYWSQDRNLFTSAVANTMTRNEFQRVFSNIHLADNSKMASKNS